jgi:5-methylcytosine-specific restriction endonuclease McrA
MIKVERYSAPPIYGTSAFYEYKLMLEKSFESRKHKDQRVFPFHPGRFELIREIKSYVSENFKGKCAYCESRTESSVDQFRPKNGARNVNRIVDANFYWWLSVEWENQYLCCSVCNRNKGNWFPVDGERISVGTPYPHVYIEQNLLIDPCLDYPEEHLDFHNNGNVFAKSSKGEITIKVLN